MLARVLHGCQVAGQPALCRRALQVLQAAGLTDVLISAYIACETATYQLRISALRLLSQVAGCLGASLELGGSQAPQV